MPQAKRRIQPKKKAKTTFTLTEFKGLLYRMSYKEVSEFLEGCGFVKHVGVTDGMALSNIMTEELEQFCKMEIRTINKFCAKPLGWNVKVVKDA